VERRGYRDCGGIPYPASLKHTLHNVKQDVQLVRFVKEKAAPEAAPSGTAPTATWHLRNAPNARTLTPPAPLEVESKTAKSAVEMATMAELDAELEEEEEGVEEEVIGVD
jgi:hypothetical protein